MFLHIYDHDIHQGYLVEEKDGMPPPHQKIVIPTHILNKPFSWGGGVFHSRSGVLQKVKYPMSLLL